METSTNLGRVSLVPRGEYNAATNYERLDIVSYEGSSYLVLREIQGITPSNGADYMLIAEKGDVGESGPQGDKGDPGEQGPEGPPGVVVTVNGQYAFEVSEDGHLLLTYAGDEAPNFYIEDDGHLYFEFD